MLPVVRVTPRPWSPHATPMRDVGDTSVILTNPDPPPIDPDAAWSLNQGYVVTGGAKPPA